MSHLYSSVKKTPPVLETTLSLTQTDPQASYRNPFVKIGDQVKLHSSQGTFRVLEVTDDFFTVSVIRRSWFIFKRMQSFNCNWSDFRCWSRKT